METREYHTISDATKAGWGSGPWVHEPDKKQWTDPATGYPCIILRVSSHGALCGYVGVSEGHPFFKRDYDEVHSMTDIEIHGGLTYADFCREGDETTNVCHVPAPGEPERVWWLGFDCVHYMDLAPAHGASSSFRFPGNSYRDMDYVTDQVERLARQFKKAESA